MLILNEKTTAKGSDAEPNGNGKKDVNLGSSGAVDEYNWSPEALERIERVPAGFMRDNTKSRVLSYADSINVKDITLEVCEQGIEESVKLMAEAVANGATLEDFLPQK